jgi:hypothetical protein
MSFIYLYSFPLQTTVTFFFLPFLHETCSEKYSLSIALLFSCQSLKRIYTRSGYIPLKIQSGVFNFLSWVTTYLFFFFGGTGVQTQGLTLAKQVLHHLSHSISLKNSDIDTNDTFVQHPAVACGR